jgi:hypothetical protein
VEDEKRQWEDSRHRSSGNSNSDSDDDDDIDPDRFLSQSPQDMNQTIRPWEDDADGDVVVDLDV